MHMAVGDFFCAGFAHGGNRAFEADFHACERVIAVHHGFAVGNVGYAVDNHAAVFGVVGFKHHAGLHFHGEHFYVFDAYQLGVLLAERVFGLHGDVHFIAHVFIVQGFFHQRENAVVAAVQVFDGFLGFV